MLILFLFLKCKLWWDGRIDAEAADRAAAGVPVHPLAHRGRQWRRHDSGHEPFHSAFPHAQARYSKIINKSTFYIVPIRELEGHILVSNLNPPAGQRKQPEHPTRKFDNHPEQAMHFPKDACLPQWFPGHGVLSFLWLGSAYAVKKDMNDDDAPCR